MNDNKNLHCPQPVKEESFASVLRVIAGMWFASKLGAIATLMLLFPSFVPVAGDLDLSGAFTWSLVFALLFWSQVQKHGVDRSVWRLSLMALILGILEGIWEGWINI